MKKEVDEKYMKQIYSNILRAILIIFYFLVLGITYQNISSEHFEIGIKTLSMVFIIATVVIYEIAYKKDDDGIAILGIEMMTLSIFTITTEYITKKFQFDIKVYSYAASFSYAIYFILKGTVLYTKGRKKMADDFSDIREIVKNKPIKKEAKKRIKTESKKTNSEKKVSKKKEVNKND